MAFYSFVVIAAEQVGIEDPLILLDVGMNVFTAHTDDLPGLLRRLREHGVTVKKCACLTEHEPVSVLDPTLPVPVADGGGSLQLTNRDDEAQLFEE